MQMKDHFRAMAAYNAWANTRVYEAAAALTGEEYRRDVKAFFHSMQGTLNHILVADRIWMKRFTGEGAHSSSLDTIIHEALGALRVLRETEDKRIIDYIEDLDADALNGRFTYTTVTDLRTISQKLAPTLDHVFNHQTHHRGHAHMILTVFGKDPPPLDLSYFFREAAGRQFA